MITVRELCREFGVAERLVVAVDGISFSVERGEVFGLLGPNGAGKTTTLRIVMGLLDPTSGMAEVDGFRADESPQEVKRRIGLVSASSGVYQWLSVHFSHSQS